MELAEQWGAFIPGNPKLSSIFVGTMIFSGVVLVGWIAYMVFCSLQSLVLQKKRGQIAAVFGYGLLPLVFGGYLAYYSDIFLKNSWRIAPNIMTMAGINVGELKLQIVASSAIPTFLHIIILGSMLASGYATYKICKRLEGDTLELKHLALPLMTVLLFSSLYLIAI